MPRQEKRGQRKGLDVTDLVPVKLLMITEGEVKLLTDAQLRKDRQARRAFNRARFARWCFEAYEQGGVLTQLDLSLLSGLSVHYISDTLREYEPVNIRGTPIACREYRDSRFHLVLEVQEGDQNKDTGARPLRYYIPAGNEFEIVNEVTTPVRFHIEAVNGQ